MMKLHFDKLQAQLMAQTDAVLIDRWNEQPANVSRENLFLPAVFINFNAPAWKTFPQGYKSASAQIEIIVCQESYRDTHNEAYNLDGKKLEVFDLPDDVYRALDGFVARDANGRTLINGMMLISSTPDTSYDAMVVDRMVFSCEIFLYSKFDEKEYTNATITTAVERQHPIVRS